MIAKKDSVSASSAKSLSIQALCIALVFLATHFINIRLPISVNGGLIHFGTGMLIIISLLYGPKTGAIAGAVGMGLFDLVSGWGLWAPFTFLIRGLQGFLLGALAGPDKKRPLWQSILAISLCGLVMMAGYYGAEGLLYGNWITPMTSMPGDLLQNVVGGIIGLPVSAVLQRILHKQNLY